MWGRMPWSQSRDNVHKEKKGGRKGGGGEKGDKKKTPSRLNEIGFKGGPLRWFH